MTLTVPNVVFKTRIRDENIGGNNLFRWPDVSTDDIFKGKKVVVLALPGALAPLAPAHTYRALKQTIRTLSIGVFMKCIA
jgi:peroxiredoxin